MFVGLQEFFARFGQVVVIFSLVIALLQCFFGYKLMKIWIAVIGFIVGFLIGFAVSSMLIKDNSYIPAIIGVITGILLALIAYKLYLVGVFIVCGITVFVAAQAIPLPAGQTWDIVKIVIGVILMIIAGILAVKFSRPMIIFTTAIGGATSAIDALKSPIPVLAENDLIFFVAAIALAIVGMIVQFKLTTDNE